MRSSTPAHARTRTLLGLVSAVLLVGLTLSGSPAHAAKPDDPPGQSKKQSSAPAASSSQAKGSSKAKSSNSSKPTKAKPTKAKSTKAAPPKKSSSHSTSGTAGTSGDPTKPQPLSNADKNTGGANGKCPGGPYCSTRDGSPSLNGNGGGKATGKPCAGCVGKADNKNPKGQYPNGSDHNKGYECDGNNGIGKTNPAHTGCKPTPPPPPPDNCPKGTTGTPPNCVPNPPDNCPEGTTGTPPNCENVEPPGDCPPGLTGVFPDCEEVAPPPPDNPGNPDNPSSPDQPKGSVAGPKAPTAAIAPAAVPTGALPQTGAGATLLGTGLAGLVMLLGGALVVARKLRNA